MVDYKKINKQQLFLGLNRFIKNDKDIYLFSEIEICEDNKSNILKSIELRNLVNNKRGVNKFVQYQRVNASEVDTKAMIGEYMFSYLLYEIDQNKRDNSIKIITPPIAELILNKEDLDYKIKNTSDGKEISFDIKSQFKNNSKQNLNVNIRSFNRMKELSEFFVYAEIDGLQNDINTNKRVRFYFIKNEWYERNSVEKLKSLYDKFSPHRCLDLSYINKGGIK